VALRGAPPVPLPMMAVLGYVRLGDVPKGGMAQLKAAQALAVVRDGLRTGGEEGTAGSGFGGGEMDGEMEDGGEGGESCGYDYLAATRLVTFDDEREETAALMLLADPAVAALGGRATRTSLPEGIGHLRRLREMDLSQCCSLERLRDLAALSASLLTLSLNGCTALVSLDGIESLRNLEKLHCMRCSSLAALPTDLRGLRALHTLDLRHCTALVALPESMTDLSNLQRLHLEGCEELADLPDLSHHQALEVTHLPPHLRQWESLGRRVFSLAELGNAGWGGAPESQIMSQDLW